MTVFADFSHKLEVILFHLGFSIEGAKQAVKGLTDKGHLLGIKVGGKPNGIDVSLLVLVSSQLHHSEEAFVMLRHANQIVTRCLLKEVDPDFSLLCISFLHISGITGNRLV